MTRADPIIYGVFGHFQNLNLLALLADLRSGKTARGTWSSGSSLCPVAHGMPVGRLVSELRFLGQAAELDRACTYAARQLGADPDCVRRFVELWDSNAYLETWLIAQLDDLWQERLADAVTVQEMLAETAWPKDAAPAGHPVELSA
jgi:hypothetical protein